MAEEKKDYYESLGLKKGATDDEIKKAFRQQAKKYHPDVNPGNKSAETRFKEINEAYEVLSDSEKKSRYDQYGHAGVDPNFSAGGFGGFGGFGGMDFDLGDLFGSIFGGGGGAGGSRNRNAPRKGERVHAEAVISFEEAAFGCEKEIPVSRVEVCSDCMGSGCQEGTAAEKCTNCNGRGTVTSQQRTPFGVMQSTTDCPTCAGRGKIIKQPCTKCRGLGLVRRNKNVKITIPAGIDEGQTISMRGQGNAGTNGGESGDLYVTIVVRKHTVFEREGTSVLIDMPVSIVQATLGAEIEVLTLDGNVKYSIPEGTQSGTVFRLRGKGIKSLRGSSRGDQYVTIKVMIPTGLNKAQKELLRQFETTLTGTSDNTGNDGAAGGFGDSQPPNQKRKRKK